MQTFFVKIDPVATAPADPATAEYNVYGVVDGKVIGDPTAPEPIGVIGFDKFGHMTAATPPYDDSNPTSLRISLDFVALNGDQPVAQDSPMEFKYNLDGSTQFGSAYSINSLKQDGYTAGKLSKFIAAKDGTIVGSYTNGTTNVLGQVVLASFVDPNGLQSLGDNQWAETSTSGPALVGAPNTGNLGALTSSSTEDSNTDLTGELVNMITAQRTYQANAQTIKTQDQVMQTLVNLR